MAKSKSKPGPKPGWKKRQMARKAKAEGESRVIFATVGFGFDPTDMNSYNQALQRMMRLREASGFIGADAFAMSSPAIEGASMTLNSGEG